MESRVALEGLHLPPFQVPWEVHPLEEAAAACLPGLSSTSRAEMGVGKTQESWLGGRGGSGAGAGSPGLAQELKQDSIPLKRVRTYCVLAWHWQTRGGVGG